MFTLLPTYFGWSTLPRSNIPFKSANKSILCQPCCAVRLFSPGLINNLISALPSWHLAAEEERILGTQNDLLLNR